MTGIEALGMVPVGFALGRAIRAGAATVRARQRGKELDATEGH
jgi:hypothetical protein